MKEYRVTRYTFAELSEAAKEKAISDAQQAAYEEDITWLLTEQLEEDLAEDLGASNELKLYYSLSYSQGDGVALDGRLDKSQAPTLTWPARAEYAYIKHSGHYYHEHSFSVSFCDAEGEDVEPEVEVMTQQLRDVCRKLERNGYAILEHYASREVALEWLNEQDADFTPEGKFSPVNAPELVNA